MINNRQVPLDILLAWTCWGVGALMILGDVLDVLHDEVGMLGIAVLAFGHLRTVQAAMLRQVQREKEAFEMGRDSVTLLRQPR